MADHDTFNARYRNMDRMSWSALNAVPDGPKKESRSLPRCRHGKHAVMEEGGNPEIEAFLAQLENGDLQRNGVKRLGGALSREGKREMCRGSVCSAGGPFPGNRRQVAPKNAFGAALWASFRACTAHGNFLGAAVGN